METFTFDAGIVSPGLELLEDSKYGWVVYLGASGDDCHFDRISLARKNPPRVEGTYVFDADVNKVILTSGDRRGRSFHLLERPLSESADCLVRVNTRPLSVQNLDKCPRESLGGWLMEGNSYPREQTFGFGVLSASMKRWHDGLFIFSPENVLVVWVWDGAKCLEWELGHDGTTLVAQPRS